MKKLNCWEFKKCGREPGGVNVDHFGTCPASVEKKFDGIHGGINGGRCCWFLAGTMCNGIVQGAFSLKIRDCLACDFYGIVKKEEFGRFRRERRSDKGASCTTIMSSPGTTN